MTTEGVTQETLEAPLLCQMLASREGQHLENESYFTRLLDKIVVVSSKFPFYGHSMTLPVDQERERESESS